MKEKHEEKYVHIKKTTGLRIGLFLVSAYISWGFLIVLISALDIVKEYTGIKMAGLHMSFVIPYVIGFFILAFCPFYFLFKDYDA